MDSDANSHNDSSISHDSDTDEASEDRIQRDLKWSENKRKARVQSKGLVSHMKDEVRFLKRGVCTR